MEASSAAMGFPMAPPQQQLQSSSSSFTNTNASATCRRCGTVGCDVKVADCGCLFHARCIPIVANKPIMACPACHLNVRYLYLMPMDFREIDKAKEAAASMAPSSKRGKKRKNATIARLNPANAANMEDGGGAGGGDGSDLRTGRWTTEETIYCDQLIAKYSEGQLPLTENIKLNDFLSNMLKSKQSRLTKKMKNAKLSAKTYKPGPGYILDTTEAREFSESEVSFYESIQCDLERAEIRFHMQKEWRELFSSFCVSIGQKLDADDWLSSVEELDRRVSQAKDAARMARRKVMMGYALSQDSMNPEQGVFIEKNLSTEANPSSDFMSAGYSAMSGALEGSAAAGGGAGQFAAGRGSAKRQRTGADRALKDFSSPFLGKVIKHVQRHQLPFEHIDAWVPSFISSPDEALAGGGGANGEGTGSSNPEQKCRLCFAGFASTDVEVPTDGGTPTPISSQLQFDLLSFGEYSSKFSFDVGCGLPGRVYSSGICSWEQGVENAPSHQFERCGGAAQWGIKTVLGVPIPSPNVGRIVVLLYSRHDRTQDPETVRRVTEELTKLMPTPKWKLVVDVGASPPIKEDDAKPADKRIAEVLKLLAENTPTHRNSPYSPYLPGFTSLRLLLLKRGKTKEDEDTLGTILGSYSSYLNSGKSNGDTAWMIARDYMLLTQPSSQQGNVSMPQTQESMQQMQQQQHQQLQAAMQAQSQAQGGNLLQQSGASGLQFRQAAALQNQILQQQQALQLQQMQAAQLHLMNSPAAMAAGAGVNLMSLRGMGASPLSQIGQSAHEAAPNAQDGAAALNQLAQQHSMLTEMLSQNSAQHSGPSNGLPHGNGSGSSGS